MSTALWFAWFFISRAATYFIMVGIWLFSGLFCLVGGPGRPPPPDSWALYWIIGTLIAVPFVAWYTLYNIRIFTRKSGQGVRQFTQFAHSEWTRNG
jgi:hypothetical protein